MLRIASCMHEEVMFYYPGLVDLDLVVTQFLRRCTRVGGDVPGGGGGGGGVGVDFSVGFDRHTQSQITVLLPSLFLGTGGGTSYTGGSVDVAGSASAGGKLNPDDDETGGDT